MPTDTDLKRVLREVLKEELKNELHPIHGELAKLKKEISGLSLEIMSTNIKVEKIDREIARVDSNLESFTDGTYNRLDKFIGELIKVRDEQAGLGLRQDDLEERVSIVELVPAVAQEIRRKKK